MRFRFQFWGWHRGSYAFSTGGPNGKFAFVFLMRLPERCRGRNIEFAGPCGAPVLRL